MKNIFKSLTIFAAVATLSSCNGTFEELAVNPNQQDVSSYYTTPDACNEGVIGIYAYLTTPRALGVSATRLMANRGDESSDRSDYGVPGQYNALLTSSWYTLVQPFSLYYTAASQACQMIEKIPDVDFQNEQLKNAYLGEAYFLRAYVHFFLLNNFRNIPIMNAFPTSSTDYKPQADPEEVWDFIIEDLKKAKDLLPAKGYWTGNNLGRVSSASAAALLGKAYLYRTGIEKYYGNSTKEYYTEAAECFDEIITGKHGNIRLVDNYSDNFQVATENNDESILEFQFKGDTENTGFNPGLTSSGLFRDPRGNQPPSFLSQNGHVIHQWVYDTFVNSLDANGYTDSRMFGTLIFDDSAPEIHAKPGDKVTCFDGKGFNEYYTKTDANGNVTTGFACVNATAGKYKSACRKNVDWTLPTTNPGNDMWFGNSRAQGLNFVDIRYADVLLMYAEAVYCGGKQGSLTPVQAVNKVRQRPSVNVVPVTYVDMDIIERERVLELTQEGQRFYDLLRWGKLAKRFKELESSDSNFKQFNSSAYLGFVEGKNEWLPIPVDEVEGNPYITSNNPGWN
jgi:hypothetical protein